jgi:hypothetical protein
LLQHNQHHKAAPRARHTVAHRRNQRNRRLHTG